MRHCGDRLGGGGRERECAGVSGCERERDGEVGIQCLVSVARWQPLDTGRGGMAKPVIESGLPPAGRKVKVCWR